MKIKLYVAWKLPSWKQNNRVNEDDISSKMKEHGRQLAERELSSEIALTLLWINSSQYDGFSHVKKIDSWTHLKSKWNFIFVWSYRQICWSLRSIQLSIQHQNREVCRLAERETSQQIADCYIKLFCALGFHDVSLNIIDTAYQSDAVHRCSQ